jgi:hypothetical protein
MCLPPTYSVVAQSANQVLSEVLSDPPAVLSARSMCCPCPERRPPAWLGRLLILLGLLGEFDGEQGLHAGVQVEDLTGPAWTDDPSVGMLKTVHRSELIMLGLLPSAQCEVKVPRQVVITNPGLTGLPIRFGEHPAIGIPGDRDIALMDSGVMPLAQQDQIV